MPRPSHRSPRSRHARAERWAPVVVFFVVAAAVVGVGRWADPELPGAEAGAEAVSSSSSTAQDAARSAPGDLTAPEPDEPPQEVVEAPVIAVDVQALREARAAERAEEQARLERIAARKAAREAKRLANQPFTLRIGSFNVLGSQHTDADGPRDRYPAASTRTPAAANLMAKHGVDILGTQELQADQLSGLQSRTGMAAYPGFSWGQAETDNSILYDAGQFELVEGSQFTAPFMGRPRPQPIARFKHLATGREFYVVNTHPSAGGGSYLTERRQAQSILVGVVNDLQETGLPVLVTGDMNDREEFYCRVVPQAGLVASNGGSYSGGCQPPPGPLPVDWVVGSGATWSDYWRDTTPVDQRISDHFFISATANVG